MTDNIIIFPKSTQNHQLQSLPEILGRVEENRKEHISYIVDDLASFIFQRAHEEGFDLERDDLHKDCTLVVESIRAMLYKAIRIDHPLQKITESVISIDSEEGEGPTVA